jgi:hypothetical protein
LSLNIRFRLKAIFVSMAFVGILAGWRVDHLRLKAQVDELTALVVRSTKMGVDALRQHEESERQLREFEQAAARIKVRPSE